MKIIILLLLITSVNFAQDESITKLFPGKWKMETSVGEIYEEWSVANETELIGKSFDVENGEKEVSEILYIKKFGKQWAYVAVPAGQNITLFALVESLPKKFIFENKEHDYPQRIIYEFSSDDKLTATIEGMINGQFKRREFTFIRTGK